LIDRIRNDDEIVRHIRIKIRYIYLIDSIALLKCL
jgi:hypothetical protein